MGLPEINIEFKGMAGSAIERSERGIVALLIKDTVAQSTSYVINGIGDLKEDEFLPKNIEFIKSVLMGSCSKVLVEVVQNAEGKSIIDTLNRLKVKRFNYLACPESTEDEVNTIVTWIKECRDRDKKSFKAVINSNISPDHEGIINFTTSEIKLKNSGKKYSAKEYTPRIAGILAGLPFTRSATYYVLPEVEEILEANNQNASINNGELILINDGEKVKIASGVNSLVTIEGNKSEDMKDILIIEKIDLIKDDIKKVFEENYVGKVVNTYDNKQLFVTNIHTYFDKLIRDYEFFDRNEINKLWVDVEANKMYLDSKGVDTSGMKESQLKAANTGKKVFLGGSVRLTNTMANLDIIIQM